ncbi:MAG: PRC-barrel domain-containing protein [Alphaproteobacteria bacterium]
MTAAGDEVGRVARVVNYGAGDVLEIERPGQESLLLPFAAPRVGVVDVEAGRVVVDPPAEVVARGVEPGQP